MSAKKDFWNSVSASIKLKWDLRGLMKALTNNGGDEIKTIGQLVMAPIMQTGLHRAARNDELGISLEQIVLDNLDEFKDYPGIERAAKWRLQLAKTKAA